MLGQPCGFAFGGCQVSKTRCQTVVESTVGKRWKGSEDPPLKMTVCQVPAGEPSHPCVRLGEEGFVCGDVVLFARPCSPESPSHRLSLEDKLDMSLDELSRSTSDHCAESPRHQWSGRQAEETQKWIAWVLKGGHEKMGIEMTRGRWVEYPLAKQKSFSGVHHTFKSND